MIKSIYIPRWICFKFYSFNWSDIYKYFLFDCFKELKDNKNCLSIIIERVQINKELEEVKLIVRTTPYDTEQIKNNVFNNFSLGLNNLLKRKSLLVKREKKQKIKTQNCLFFDDFHVVSRRGLDKVFYENLLPFSTSIMMESYSEKNFNLNNAMNKIIPLNLALLYTFEFSNSEMRLYFSHFYSLLEKHFLNKELKAKYFSNLENTFSTQKNDFDSVINYIIKTLSTKGKFEEQWLNLWVKSCQQAKKQALIMPAEYKNILNPLKSNTICDVDDNEKWSLFLRLTRLIHKQMGIPYLIELNFMYSLKESLQAS